MSKNLLHAAAALIVVAVMVGCGGGQKPAEVKKPAEPVFTAEVKNMDKMLVASIAKVGPYSGSGEAIQALLKWVADKKITPVGAPFGMFMDDPSTVKPESTRYEICIAVPAGTKSDKKAGVVVKQVGPLMMATTIHAGAYDKVSETYGKLMKWVADSKYQIAGPSIEFYTSAPNTPTESLKTEVAFVVKPVTPPADTGKTPEGKKLPVPGKK